MQAKCFLFLVVLVFFALVADSSTTAAKLRFAHHETDLYAEPKQVWNYTKVRENAYMFWWLYYTTAPEGYAARPLVIWLQGGPGASSTGYGNFMEIGPLDVNLNRRNVTWVSAASILFIDNPVGTGYSYVTEDSAYTRDVHQIGTDLVTMFTAFLKQLPDFQNIPLYIFSESYGGKMAAAFSQVLHKILENKIHCRGLPLQNVVSKRIRAIAAQSLKCDFRGFAMGDSWISPIDSVLTWGPYLYATSLVDETGLESINSEAAKCADALARGDFTTATQLWESTEEVLEEVTGGVNIYNILKWGEEDNALHRHASDQKQHMYDLLVGVMNGDSLYTLMNGPIRKKLGIIPASVTWGGQSQNVFYYQTDDFMKPVVNIVDNLLNTTELEVVVYNGQLDCIVDTLGTAKWVQSLKWPGLPSFNSSERILLQTQSNLVAGFVKSYKNFSFYWIVDAGHMVPSDAPDSAMLMLMKVLHLK